MDSNKLKLNAEKTEVMKVGMPSRLDLIDSDSIVLEGHTIQFQSSVKYLGVKLDSSFSMHPHISSVCQACFLELRRISTIRKFLSRGAVQTLVCATVISRLDYCNGTFIDITSKELNRLERVQNAAARLILKKRKRDHITPLLRELHWLPVKARCEYKIAVLAYRYFDGTLAPSLATTLSQPTRNRVTRSTYNRILFQPKFKLKSAGARAFSVSAPKVWNSLPISLRESTSIDSFKSKLKSHLFRKYLDD